MADESLPQVCKREVFAGHRWGQHGEMAEQEYDRLLKLWVAIQSPGENTSDILDQIAALEICNWNLEESILALCEAIGNDQPATLKIGHLLSVSEERWKQVWAYYLSLRNWLGDEKISGYSTLLTFCDLEKVIRTHVEGMLGARSKLKELYAERLCLSLERWLRGYVPADSYLLKGHLAAEKELEDEIKLLDPEAEILIALKLDGDGRLQPCSHKAFRRYDIIISSIGCGKWRGVIPMRGIDGFERADLLASYLEPIETWIEKGKETKSDTSPGAEILSSLGEPDGNKVFLASLLVSLLRAQELAARKRAESRSRKED